MMKLLAFLGGFVPVASAQMMIGDGPISGAATAVPIDFTAIAVAVVGGLITVIGSVGVAFINARMKDAQSAQALSNALTNSLGAVKQAVDANLSAHPLQATIPGVTPAVAAGVQYVLNNAGDEAERFGITPAGIANKIDAKLGLAKLAPVAAPTPPIEVKK